MAVGFFEAFVKIWQNCWVEWEKNGPTKTFLTDFMNEVSIYGFISTKDVLLTLSLGVFFTILRYLLTVAVFKSFFSWCRLLEKEQKKAPESAFKFLYYSMAYGYTCYILFNGKYSFFQEPKHCWIGWYKGMPVAQDIYVVYVVQAGFYLHSIYATVFMDQWRRDFILMILHHILTFALLTFSFAIRYHRIGLLVLFLHDVCDVFLELAKLFVAFKTRGGKYCIVSDVLAGINFCIFTLSWFYCRLYLYPIKVLYSCGSVEARDVLPTAPFYFFFNTMLWCLLVMNVWWFQYILLLLIRIVLGNSGLEDTREIKKPEMTNGEVFENGDVSTVNHGMYNSKDDRKKIDQNFGGLIEKDRKEQFRRRQPLTKPASP
ncbi:ceramide synthase 1-like [Acropora palmata]|uniref:ceramide synthase 1-like n=1 Tax=Acropora palmata TaxID=6131 RepID=UPI003DA1018F